MKNKITVVTIICSILFLSSCRSTTPMPVQISQPGDPQLSCESISVEIEDMLNKVKQKDSNHTTQVASNVALGVTGVFLIVPWFFIDTSDAYSIEAQAAKERYTKLQRMYVDKKCDLKS